MARLSDALTFGPTISDWQERIDVGRLRSERAARARRIMRERGVPALLVTRPENTRYLAGLRGPEFQPQLWYVLFFVEHEPVVFHHAGWLHHYPSQAPWITEWRLARASVPGAGPEVVREEATLFARGIHDELAARGLDDEPLAIAGFDRVAHDALVARGITVVEGASLMLEAAKIKTRDEIACLKMAYALADVAWYRFWDLLRPGANGDEAAHVALLEARRAGADDVPAGNVRSGPMSFDRAYEATGRRLDHGDLAYAAFCGVSYLGYRTCYYRTFSIGREPSAQARDWYARLVDRLDRVIDAIRPGATTADAALHFSPASTWGYADEAEVLTLEIGHGVGLRHYGYPIINRQWSLDHPQVFEPGMTIAIEGREGAPGVGGVRLEDTVVVTEDGVELLDRFPREEILVAPRV